MENPWDRVSISESRKERLLVGGTLCGPRTVTDRLASLIEAGGNALQILLSSPMNSLPGKSLTKLEVSTIADLRAMGEGESIYIVVHGKYMLNFCRPVDEKDDWQTTALLRDLREAAKIGADVIIHQGKNVKELKISREMALLNYVEGVVRCLRLSPELSNRILLENSCQQGNELGYTVEELAQIWKLIPPEWRGRVGFCLDLCHVFVAGTCDVRQPGAVDRFMGRFDDLIGLEHLRVIHFNDSKTVFGGCNDHHADLGWGEIGGLGRSVGMAEVSGMWGLQRVVRWGRRLGIPMILETPGEHCSGAAQMNLLKLLSHVESQEQMVTVLRQYRAWSGVVVALDGLGRAPEAKDFLAPTMLTELPVTAVKNPDDQIGCGCQTLPTVTIKKTLTRPEVKIIRRNPSC